MMLKSIPIVSLSIVFMLVFFIPNSSGKRAGFHLGNGSNSLFFILYGKCIFILGGNWSNLCRNVVNVNQYFI